MQYFGPEHIFRLTSVTTAPQALERLKQGNLRFVSGLRAGGPVDSHRREELVNGQTPFAAILGCSDSRVPVELVFDQGPGDLFVVRVAGNVVAPPQTGSVEFAVSNLGCALVVVLGHSRCGAVEAALEEIRQPSKNLSPNLRAIIDSIRPLVSPITNKLPDTDHDTLVPLVVRANILASMSKLIHGSEMLEQSLRERKLMVAGAEYDLASGKVDFFEKTPD